MNKYLKLKTVADKYYPNEGGYCCVIAAALAMDCSFGKARSAMYRISGRSDRRGMSVTGHLTALQAMGYKARQLELASAKTLVTAQRALQSTKGTYFIYTGRHVTCIIDGVCEDWSNNEFGQKKLYRVESIYKIEKV